MANELPSALLRVRSGAPPPPREDVRETSRQVAATVPRVKLFTDSARAAGAVVESATRDSLAAHVADAMRRRSVRRAWVDPRLAERDALAAAGFDVTAAAEDDTLFAVDATVTPVDAAIAATGSIVCSTAGGAPRLSSVIAPLHVAVVLASQICADLADYFAAIESAADIPASVALITGPSKTADIEGTLVTGVHGPAVLHVVIVTDA